MSGPVAEAASEALKLLQNLQTKDALRSHLLHSFILDMRKWIPKRLRKPYSCVTPELRLEPGSS